MTGSTGWSVSLPACSSCPDSLVYLTLVPSVRDSLVESCRTNCHILYYTSSGVKRILITNHVLSGIQLFSGQLYSAAGFCWTWRREDSNPYTIPPSRARNTGALPLSYFSIFGPIRVIVFTSWPFLNSLGLSLQNCCLSNGASVFVQCLVGLQVTVTPHHLHGLIARAIITFLLKPSLLVKLVYQSPWSKYTPSREVVHQRGNPV